jgi:hypothetical protein
MKCFLSAIHEICSALNNYAYENLLFSKHLIYLKDHKDNFDNAVALNKIMMIMGNMIDIFDLQTETDDDFWK